MLALPEECNGWIFVMNEDNICEYAEYYDHFLRVWKPSVYTQGKVPNSLLTEEY